MKKNIFLTCVLLLIAMTMISASPMKKSDVVYFTPRSDEVTIESGQIGVFRNSWANCSYGLSFDWINASVQHLILRKDGEVITTITVDEAAKDKYWSDPYIYNDLDGNLNKEMCAWPVSDMWRVDWQHNSLIFKEPGIYQLDVYLETNVSLIDGFAINDPVLDIYDPQIWWNKTITIIVE